MDSQMKRFLWRFVVPILVFWAAGVIIFFSDMGNKNVSAVAFLVTNGGLVLVFAANMGWEVWRRGFRNL